MRSIGWCPEKLERIPAPDDLRAPFLVLSQVQWLVLSQDAAITKS
jgi:hypothetical protein